MRCGYLLLALAAFFLQLSMAASIPVRPSASAEVEKRCPRMMCRIEEPASVVTTTATFMPAAAATATTVTTVDSASSPATSTTAVPSAPASAQPVSTQVASLRAFLAAFMEALKTAVSAMCAEDDATVTSESSEPLALASALVDPQENTTLASASVKRRVVSLKTFSHHYRVGQATH